VSGAGGSEARSQTAFALGPVIELRERAVRARAVSAAGAEGWSKSDTDPEQLLEVFAALRLRPGLTLRAYQYSAGRNGNGIVYAMPADAPFPEPRRCTEGPFSPVPGVVLETPRPPNALEELMEAIEGDGSPWSYLSASLFAREAREFGALWHGAIWSDVAVLGGDPWAEAPDQGPSQTDYNRPRTPRSEWEWKAESPEDWRPRVRGREDGVEVAFTTFTALDRESLWQHVDRYGTAGYSFAEAGYEIASGGRGFIY
jgi:hypothetical protein